MIVSKEINASVYLERVVSCIVIAVISCNATVGRLVHTALQYLSGFIRTENVKTTAKCIVTKCLF